VVQLLEPSKVLTWATGKREAGEMTAGQFGLYQMAYEGAVQMIEDGSRAWMGHIGSPPGKHYFVGQFVLARWEEVFEEAGRQGVAIEIDGDPYRQDLDYALARRALEAGCLFALDSDAHAGDQLDYTDFALAHARLAGIPAERVINTWSAEKLLDWARRRTAAG